MSLPSATNSNVLINNRNGMGTITTLNASASRTLGLITFDNSMSRLGALLNFDTNVSGETATARTLTLHSGVTLQNTVTTVAFRGNTGTLSVVLGANNVFTTSAGSYLQFNSGVAISGGFGIILAGAGSVGLNAQNTFSGGLTVGSGTTLRVGAGTQTAGASSTVTGGVLVSGQVGTGTLSLQDGSTLVSGGSGARALQNELRLAGNITIGAPVEFTGELTFDSDNSQTTPATIVLGASTTLTTTVATRFLNPVSGGFSLTKQGSGSLTLSSAVANTYSGGTNISAGTVFVGLSGALGAGTVNLGSVGGGDASLVSFLAGYTYSNPINVVAGSGGTLTLGYTSTANFNALFSGAVTLNDNLVLQSGSGTGFALRLSGAISGSQNLTKTDSGTVILSNNNPSYAGVTTVSEGTLQVGNNATTGALGSGNVINNATLRVNRTNAYTLSNSIGGTGGLIQAGTGTTTLTAANSYTGPTQVTGGTLGINGSINGSTSVAVTGGTLLLGASNVINNDAPVTLTNGTLRTGGNSEAATDAAGLGALIIASTSTVDFGSGTSTLWFSELQSISGTLNIDNWSGSPAGGGTDQLRFTSDPSALLGQISFTGIGGASQVFFGNAATPYYEIVAIPEPSTTALLASLALFGLIGCRERHRLLRRRAASAIS